MELSDFQKRILGFPSQAFGMQGGEADLDRARNANLGQIGLALMAASGRMPEVNRMAALAQGLGQVQDPQSMAMNYAQQRLMQSAMQSKMGEMQRQETLREKLADPAYLPKGVTPQLAEMIGIEGVSKIAIANATKDPLEAEKIRAGIARDQAEIAALQGPKIGPIGQDADGNTIYGDQRTGRPINATPAAPAAAATGVEAPAGVNPREFRKKQADLAATSAAAEATQKKYIDEQFNPALADYDKAVRDGIGAGAFGPVGASAPMRALTAFSGAEAARQRVEQAGNRLAFELAKRANGGKLDSKGLTDTELKKYYEQLVPLYANNPEALLGALEKNYGFTPPSSEPAPEQRQQPQALNIPAGAIDMLKKNPAMSGQFDAKYGAGSAAKVLGQ
jgi:hypothetical protein